MGIFDMFKKDYIKLANAASENGDQKSAAEYYEKAFTFNVKDPQLLFLAAIRYENLRDYKSMVRCVEQGAKEKHPKCLAWMGELYRDGIYVQQSWMLAENYFQLATMLGCVGAYKDWGRMYCEIGDNVDNNVNASKNSSNFGVTIKKDYHRAMELFKKGCDKGHGGCANEVGNMYAQGLGVSVDIKEAVKYFKIAAELNNSTGALNLAISYYEGWTGEQNDELAFEYFIKADKLGSTVAKKYLSPDKTKLRSHLEMNVKKFAKDTLTNAAQQLADNLVNSAVNNIIS